MKMKMRHLEMAQDVIFVLMTGDRAWEVVAWEADMGGMGVDIMGMEGMEGMDIMGGMGLGGGRIGGGRI